MAIWQRKPSGVRLTTYQKVAPTIYAIAKGLLDHVHIRHKWGKVGRHDEWMTVQAGIWYENSRFRHRGQRMRLIDVCKMLVGKTKAIGNTDVPTPLGWDHDTGWEHNLVTCLRLDVDMKQSWRRRNLDAIAQQVRAERAIARSLGLPYRCFRMGGKGHQIVIPLPVPTPHLLAWWWMMALKTLIESHRHPDAILFRLRGPRKTASRPCVSAGTPDWIYRYLGWTLCGRNAAKENKLGPVGKTGIAWPSTQ